MCDISMCNVTVTALVLYSPWHLCRKLVQTPDTADEGPVWCALSAVHLQYIAILNQLFSICAIGYMGYCLKLVPWG